MQSVQAATPSPSLSLSTVPSQLLSSVSQISFAPAYVALLASLQSPLHGTKLSPSQSLSREKIKRAPTSAPLAVSAR